MTNDVTVGLEDLNGLLSSLLLLTEPKGGDGCCIGQQKGAASIGTQSTRRLRPPIEYNKSTISECQTGGRMRGGSHGGRAAIECRQTEPSSRHAGQQGGPMHRIIMTLAAAAAMLPGACGGPGVVEDPVSDGAPAPDITDTDLAALSAGNGEFALALFGRLCLESGDGNVTISPYSISSALAMTWAGASGTTAEEMASVLGFDMDPPLVHAGFRRISEMLGPEARAELCEGAPVELDAANAVWAEAGFRLLDPFVGTVTECYGAEARNVDFSGDPEAQRRIINGWVAEKTNGRIEDLLGPGSVSCATRVILTNAVYFKGSWIEEFDPDQTFDGAFTTLEGEEKTVPLMHRTADTDYYDGEGYRAVSLPYSDGAARMVAILPDRDIREFEQRLAVDDLKAMTAGFARREVFLAMPRFECTSSYSLPPVLSGMGMPSAFDPLEADFSGMTGGRDLFVSDVVHKAFVKVDETGTEAAAATGAAMALTAMPQEQPVQFVLDRPFLFLIIDDLTGTVLFMGRVADPEV